MKTKAKPPAPRNPLGPVVIGDTIEITQDGAEVGFDKRLTVGARFHVIGHRYKAVPPSGMLGMTKLEAVKDGAKFETAWFRAKIVRFAPVICPGCGEKFSPNADGSFNHHGSLGWSCDGKTRRSTAR